MAMQGLSDSIPPAPGGPLVRQHRGGQRERSQPVPVHADAGKHRVNKLWDHATVSNGRGRRGRSTMKRTI